MIKLLVIRKIMNNKLINQIQNYSLETNKFILMILVYNQLFNNKNNHKMIYFHLLNQKFLQKNKNKTKYKNIIGRTRYRHR